MDKKSKLPLIITISALFAIIVVTAAVTLVLRDRGGARFIVDDVPYPYSWTEQTNGSILLTLETGDAPDGEWSLESTDGGTLDVHVGKARSGKVSVTMKPGAEGREMIVFGLASGEERLAELSITVMAERESEENNKLAATITAHRERVFQSTVRGGEDTGHPFTVRSSDDGLTIFVEESEGYTDDDTAWVSESTNAMAAYVSSVDVSSEGITFRLETRSSGNAELTVYSERENISFVFDVEVTNGDMRLIDSRVEPYSDEGSGEEAEPGETETAEPTETETTEPMEAESAEPMETNTAAPIPGETEAAATESEAQP